MEQQVAVENSALVLTTQERFGMFSAIVGDGVDARFDPNTTYPVEDLLFNCAVSGGKLAIIDEDHFLEGKDMVRAIRAYLDAPESRNKKLRIVVVCSRRKAGDKVLAYLVMYCGLLDVIYDCEGASLSAALARVLKRPNQRHDVLELFAIPPQPQRETGESRGKRVPRVIEWSDRVLDTPSGDKHNELKISMKIEI